MEQGKIYFLKDEYFTRFNDDKLMRNKGEGHKRPCFFAFRDGRTNLYWLVPLSSKVEKYRKLFEFRKKKYGKCDTIVFGKFLGKENVFLIQNMCPATDYYVESEYVVTDLKQPATVNKLLSSEIITKAKRALVLCRQGKGTIFPDVVRIEKELLQS